MKKYIKLILVFVLGIFSAVGLTVIATNISSKNIVFKSTEWNVKNVDEAVSYLKDKNKCSGIYPQPAKLISGDKNTVGSVVQIGNEEFFVIGEGTGKEAGFTKLLTKYSLGNNSQMSKKPPTSHFATTNYWANNVGDGKKYPGSYCTNPSSPYIREDGCPYPYIYDENSLIYPIINDYVDKLKDYGFSSISGRLISFEEVFPLPESVRKNGQTYWVGSGTSNYNAMRLDSGNLLLDNWCAYDGSNTVRPVILIPTNEIGR